MVSEGELVAQHHRSRLPYVESVLAEVWRLGPIAPIALNRGVEKETKLGGYTLKPGDLILPLIFSLTLDKEVWGEDVHTFRPERHLDEKGSMQLTMSFTMCQNDSFIDILNTEKMYIFGFGRRRCLGETVAKSEGFLFLANLLHHFKIKAGEGMGNLPDPRIPKDGFALGPRKFTAKFTQL